MKLRELIDTELELLWRGVFDISIRQYVVRAPRDCTQVGCYRGFRSS